MIYLYAFVDEAGPGVQDLRGLDDVPLQRVTRGRVSAVFSVHRRLNTRPDVASLRRHDQVVTALMHRGTVAPARFGSTLAHVESLEEVLAMNALWLTPVLARLRGKCELSVRAAMPDGVDGGPTKKGPAPAPPTSGRAYLRGLPRDPGHRAAAALHPSLARLHERLALRAQAWTLGEGPDHSMVGAYLVVQNDTETFRRDLALARAELPHLRVSLTGPWAAYSFVKPENLVDA